MTSAPAHRPTDQTDPADDADHATPAAAPTTETTPTGRLLTGSLLVAPLIYLAADSTYAALGWDAAPAGVLHIVGAIAYAFVVLRVASWLPAASRIGTTILVTGMLGFAGNVAYGFDTLHMALGDVALVHRSGTAFIIKPLGLFFPVSFLVVALALTRLGHRWQGILVLLAMLAWPVAHIGNIASLAVIVNLALVIAFGSLLFGRVGFGRAVRRGSVSA